MQDLILGGIELAFYDTQLLMLLAGKNGLKVKEAIMDGREGVVVKIHVGLGFINEI